jgi:hypothetical protein
MLLTETKLLAYAGNELDPREVDAIEAAMAAEPEFARRAVLAVLQRRLATPANGAARLLGPGEAGRATTAPSRPAGWRVLWPIAAGFAFAVIGAILYLAAPPRADAAIGLGRIADPPLQAALDRIPTGADDELPRGKFRGIASFAVADGRLCREFSLSRDATASDAVACRWGNAWTVTFALLESAADDYAPAGGGDAMAAYLQGLGAGPPLTEPVERKLLRGSS